MAGEQTVHRTGSEGGNPPWKARTIWIAAGLTLLGLVLWVATPPLVETASPDSEQASFTESSEAPEARTIRSLQGSPALFRFGLSYIAGFFLGYGLRRCLKLTLGIAVLFCGVVLVLQQVGWVELDWTGIESQLSHSFGWLKGQAEALKQFVTGYVPSAGAAAVGLFFGARWR